MRIIDGSNCLPGHKNLVTTGNNKLVTPSYGSIAQDRGHSTKPLTVAQQDLKSQFSHPDMKSNKEGFVDQNQPDLVPFHGYWCINAETDIIPNHGVMMATNVFLKCNICSLIYYVRMFVMFWASCPPCRRF